MGLAVNRATGACGILCAVRVIRCRGKQWRHAYKKRILSGAKEDEGGSSREEFTLNQGRTTVGILIGRTQLNLTVSRSMAVLTVTAAR